MAFVWITVVLNLLLIVISLSNATKRTLGSEWSFEDYDTGMSLKESSRLWKAIPSKSSVKLNLEGNGLLHVKMSLKDYIIFSICTLEADSPSIVEVFTELNSWLSHTIEKTKEMPSIIMQSILDPTGRKTKTQLSPTCMAKLIVSAVETNLEPLVSALLHPLFLAMDKADPKLCSVLLKKSAYLTDRFEINEYLELMNNSRCLDGGLADVTKMLVAEEWPLLDEDSLGDMKRLGIDISRYQMFAFVSQTTAFQNNEFDWIIVALLKEFGDYDNIDTIMLRAAEQEIGEWRSDR